MGLSATLFDHYPWSPWGGINQQALWHHRRVCHKVILTDVTHQLNWMISLHLMTMSWWHLIVITLPVKKDLSSRMVPLPTALESSTLFHDKLLYNSHLLSFWWHFVHWSHGYFVIIDAVPLNHRLNFSKQCTMFSSFTHNLSACSPLLETEAYREHSSMLNQRNWGCSKISFTSLTENLKWWVSCNQNSILGPFIFYGHLFWRYYLCLLNVESETLNFPLLFIVWPLYLKGKKILHTNCPFDHGLCYASWIHKLHKWWHLKRYSNLPAGQLLNRESLPVLGILDPGYV